MTMSNLTDRTVQKAIRDAKAAGADVWVTDAAKSRGVGRLRLRASANGRAAFYFRYTSPEGKQAQLPLGIYDSDGKAGLALRDATARAGELSRLYQDGHRDLHAYLAYQEAEQAAAIKAARHAREEAERQSASGSLEALCNGYVAHLERLGKTSARAVRSLFRKNVTVAFPHLAATRARHITHKDVNLVLSTLIDGGKGRTAGKLRSYLRAAYTLALDAEYDPTVHPDLHGFALEANPVAAIPAKAFKRYNRALKRTLNESELRTFMLALNQQQTLYSEIVTLALFLGGQRIAQLLRLRPADVDPDGRTIVLLDPKGKRQTAYVHVVPLNEKALGIVTRMLAINEHKPFLFALNKVAVRPEKLSAVVAGISTAMVKDKLAREPFQLRDIRRTCETMLAGMGISRDLRAQLLSHGISGVQHEHYDMYEYLDEKRVALNAWAAKLDEIATGKTVSNVVPLHA
jgi:integrase